MSKKKRMRVWFIIFPLLVTTLLVGCDEDNMQPKKSLPEFSQIIDKGKLDNLSLTIYYMDPYIFTVKAVSVDELIDGRFEYKIVVSGNRLESHIELLERMSKATLIPIEREYQVLDTRIYYVFETMEDGKIFDVAMWGDNSIFVNGVEAEVDKIFYEILIPFLPEDAIEESRGWLWGEVY